MYSLEKKKRSYDYTSMNKTSFLMILSELILLDFKYRYATIKPFLFS